MRWSPAVTVAAVIRRHDCYLMVEERPDGEPVLNQPAGHLEYGETLLDAVQREVLEETGRRFVPTALVGVYQWTLPGSQRTYLRFCFCGDVGEPLADQAIDPAIIATHWLTRDAIATGPIATRSPMVLRCIDDAERPLARGLEALYALG